MKQYTSLPEDPKAAMSIISFIDATDDQKYAMISEYNACNPAPITAEIKKTYGL